MKPDQERVKNLLADTVTLLCKNGLNFHKELRVQGLIGITLDDNEVFIVHINERLASTDNATAGQSAEKENPGKLTSSGSSGDKVNTVNQNLASESCEKLLHDTVMFPMTSTNTEHADLTADTDGACTVIKIEKVENSPVTEQPGPYDKMVDFASFLPDFSTARYTSNLPSLHHGNVGLPGLPSVSEVLRSSKRKRNSGLPFPPKTSEGECSDSGLINESASQGSLPSLSFHNSRIRRTATSSLAENSEMLLEQNTVDISGGMIDKYTRARAVAPAYFDVGVDCSGQSSQNFESQQLVSLNYRWKRRSQHSLEKPFHCAVPGCSRSYWNMPDLYRHRKMNHGICGRSQARKKAEQDLQNSRLQ